MTRSTLCDGETYEVRQCLFNKQRMCRLSNETVTEEFKLECRGVNMDDIKGAGKYSQTCSYINTTF